MGKNSAIARARVVWSKGSERDVSGKVRSFDAGPSESERDLHFIFSTKGRHQQIQAGE